VTAARPAARHSADVLAGDREFGATRTSERVTHPLLRTSLVELGDFRCPPGHPSWRQANSIGDKAHLVFPGTPVGITRDGFGRQVQDRNWVVLYRPDETYLRDRLHPAGDVCSYVALEPPLVQELADATAAAGSPWQHGRVPVDSSAWMRYQVLLGRAREGRADPLAVEGVVTEVLGLTAPAGGGDRVRARRGKVRRTWLDIANETAAVINRQLEDRLTLSELSGAVGVSAFHLCRVFRAVTGTTVHAYREQLRLRSAFVRLSDPDARLSDIAGRVGFASHSHLTNRFAMSFGVPPSAIRSLNTM
jgi:AraC-like DNA-binding protein